MKRAIKGKMELHIAMLLGGGMIIFPVLIRPDGEMILMLTRQARAVAE